MSHILPDSSRVSSPRAFREYFTANGFCAVDQLLDEELFAAARARLDDILARRTTFPKEALNTERQPVNGSTEHAIRKLKDVAHNDTLFAELARNDRILDLVQ